MISKNSLEEDSAIIKVTSKITFLFMIGYNRKSERVNKSKRFTKAILFVDRTRNNLILNLKNIHTSIKMFSLVTGENLHSITIVYHFSMILTTHL